MTRIVLAFLVTRVWAEAGYTVDTDTRRRFERSNKVYDSDFGQHHKTA